MILWTQKAANEKIEGLNRELQTASADLVAANDARTTAESRVGELEREATEHAVQIQERDEKITKLEADLAAANGNQITQEALEAKAIELVAKDAPPEPIQKLIAQRVTEQLAAAGASKPIENADKNVSAKTITRTEFNSLSNTERNEWIRSGGKLS